MVSSVHVAVRDQLRHDILTGTFPGGTRLQQTELANYYQVSVTPIREALRELASEGLVDFGPFSGAVVHAATISELRHVYEVRAHLYTLGVRSVVEHITESELDRAQQLVDEMGRTSPAESWALQNREFHRILDGAMENSYLAEILLRLGDVSFLYVHISDRGAGRRSKAHIEHRDLLNAFRRRDAEEATRFTLLHIKHTLEDATAVLSDHGSGARELDAPGRPGGLTAGERPVRPK